MKIARWLVLVVGFCGFSVHAQAQQTNPSQVQVEQQGNVPVFRVTVVSRTVTAVNYLHRSGATKMDFQGTALMPRAHGVAKVESKQGRIAIDTKFADLTPASQYGPEYLTYVLWAITPEGRSINLGEILLNGSKSGVDVTTDLQAFGLIVTAEPYYAVTQPSDVVVMENIVRPDTLGKIEQVNAKYGLLQRGQYTLNADRSKISSVQMDHHVPLELYEARNAVEIARWSGADRYAADSFQKAEQFLQEAESEQRNKTGKKPVAQSAREAVQTAEDARLIALKRQQDEQQANERAAAAQREAQAKARADAEASERQAAERAKQEAQAATAQAQQEKQEAEAARAAAVAQQQSAEAARAAAVAQQQSAEAEAEKARLATTQAEQEKAQLREQLRQQLNLILETRETARGLIVNMSDVLFDFGKYTLKPGAREKLAKISGIILAHPGLKLAVEGHTDSVGGDEFNQRLSEQRANAVRDYLVQQGVAQDSITARGFGKTRPVATNDTPAGRQQNRRVELVVSGDVIGASIGQQK